MSLNYDRKPTAVLFSPFVYIAGARAMGFGLLSILVAGLIGALGRTHFDGVLDVHVGARAPVWFFLSEGVVDWLCVSVMLLIAGAIVSTTAFRAIDVLGTQALARWPTVFISLVALPEGFRRFTHHLVQQLSNPAPVFTFNTPDAAVFIVVLIATILLTIWLIVLMYQAYCVACNVKGGKAIGTFIAALLLAEVLSKIAIYSMAKLAWP